MPAIPPRYALYYVPERGCVLERLGSALLGRDVYTGALLMQPVLPGLQQDELFSLTRDARRYGLHATLKPPFFLKPGVTEEELVRAAEQFAGTKRTLPLPGLRVKRMASFFALAMQPRTGAEAVEAEKVRVLAREAVSFFDSFRAPPSEEELARRRQQGLTPRQEQYLLRWGYPHVFDEFRFHITLAGAARDQQADAALETGLRRYLAPGLDANRIKAVCVCRSNGEGGFTVLHRAELPAESFSPRCA
jgi:hypothetical protein